MNDLDITRMQVHALRFPIVRAHQDISTHGRRLGAGWAVALSVNK